MKLQLWILFVFSATITACKKDVAVNLNPVAGETGWLLSVVIEGTDTTLLAEYNNNNQLTKLLTPLTICDSIVYNSKGQLIACRHRLNTVEKQAFRTSCTYGSDAIQAIAVDSASPLNNPVRQYALMDAKIADFKSGWKLNGSVSVVTTPYSYLYSNGNLVKCIQPMPAADNYQPIDSFAYHSDLYNPYRTMGEHVWILVKEILGTFSSNILLAESKNLAAFESYAFYSVSNTTLIFSGTYTYTTTVISTMAENKLLPTMVKKVDDSGAEKLIRFIYTKKK